MGLFSSHTRGLAFTSAIIADLQAWSLPHYTALVEGEVGERTGKKMAQGWPPPYKARRRPEGDQPDPLEGGTDTCQWAWSWGSAAKPSSCWFVKTPQWLGAPGGPRCMPTSKCVCEYHLSST